MYAQERYVYDRVWPQGNTKKDIGWLPREQALTLKVDNADHSHVQVKSVSFALSSCANLDRNENLLSKVLYQAIHLRVDSLQESFTKHMFRLEQKIEHISKSLDPLNGNGASGTGAVNRLH